VVATPQNIRLSPLIGLWIGIGLTVAVSSACSSPTTPGSEPALRSRLVSATDLGSGWSLARTPTYARNVIIIPCPAHCVAPQPRGNGVRETFHSGESDLNESIIWMTHTQPLFDEIEQGARTHGPGVVPAPQIGSVKQVGRKSLVATNPTTYSFVYWVEADGYLGLIQCSGCDTSEIRAAVDQFASGD